jgi:hypothetical protein
MLQAGCAAPARCAPRANRHRCLTANATEPLGQPLYQVVTRDKGTGDVVVKVINARPRSKPDEGRSRPQAAEPQGHAHSVTFIRLTRT